MRTLRIFSSNINQRYIDEAITSLEDGGLIIYPTDSLYAIGCDATNVRAIEHVCRIKDIDPKRQHLAIMCADLSQAARYAKIDNNAFDVMRRHLPGAFTFILPAASSLPKPFKGRKEVGVRVPDDAVARKLAEDLGRPLLTTTLMLDNIDATDDHLAMIDIADRYAADIDLLLDAGGRGAIPSTVVSLLDSASPEVIRQGAAQLNI